MTFTAAADIGSGDKEAGPVLGAIADAESDFLLVVGDLSYGELEPPATWCDWVKAYFSPAFPIEIVVGNHDVGSIREFTPCLPDRLGAAGDYGVEYFFDGGPLRVIMVAADLSVDGVEYHYDTPGPHRDWLLARIDEAEAAGLWTVVGTHLLCVSAGDKSCEIGETMVNDLIHHGVDLILHGHDHNYQRSHQLRCIEANTTAEACIADTDSAFIAEDGAVIVVSGWVGQSAYDTRSSDPEADYFATLGGPNVEGWGPGYLTVTATATDLTGTWTTVGGGSGDTFTISR